MKVFRIILRHPETNNIMTVKNIKAGNKNEALNKLTLPAPEVNAEITETDLFN